MKIQEINQIALHFLHENLSDDAKVISVAKQGESWKVVAEVFEESTFIKSIGLKTNVKDRHLYELLIDAQGEIGSFSRAELAQ